MSYIHGTEAEEQQRLAALNELINPAFLEFLQLDGATGYAEMPALTLHQPLTTKRLSPGAT